MMKRAVKPSLVGIGVLILACSPPWVGLFGGTGGIGDMYLYRLYGHRMTHGLWPYHNFFFDWPPGSVLPVFLPTLAPGNYFDAFNVIEVLYGCGAIVAVAVSLVALGARGIRLYGAVAAAAAFPFALGAISIDSLDYWPALFTAAALAAFLVGRDRLGFGLLGFGIAAKIYPIVIVPVALVWLWRRVGRSEAIRGLVICAAVGIVASLPFAIVGTTGLGYTLETQVRRGLQMESLPASILMAASRLGIHHVTVVVGKPYSLDIAGGTATVAAVLFTLLLIGALLAVYLAYAAGPDEPQRFVTAAVASVTAYVAFNRVLSPQYLVWLFPLVPLVAGAYGVVATALLFGACALTMTWFPGRFSHLEHVSPVAWFALGRNVLLVLVFVAVATPLVRSMERTASDTVSHLASSYRRRARAMS